jgi:hypothetical protein
MVPLSVMYASVCPAERTYNFNEWAFALNETNNATFVTNAV